MAKRQRPSDQGGKINVRVVTQFRHDGKYLRVGELVELSAAEAEELAALRFVEKA